MGFSRQAITEIGVEELDSLLAAGDVTLIDVREEWEYRRRRVASAKLVPLGQFAAAAANMPRDGRIAIICEHGNRSLAAAEYLLRLGFPDVVSVRGGTDAWARSKRPTEKD
jgi:sulfur dioxygenase